MIFRPILKEKGPINIKIQGLEIMNDDPEKVKILYGKVLKNDTLQEIANKTQNFFVEKGKSKAGIIDFIHYILFLFFYFRTHDYSIY